MKKYWDAKKIYRAWGFLGNVRKGKFIFIFFLIHQNFKKRKNSSHHPVSLFKSSSFVPFLFFPDMMISDNNTKQTIPYIIHQVYIDEHDPDGGPPKKFQTNEYIGSILEHNDPRIFKHKFWTSRMIDDLLEKEECLSPWKEFYYEKLRYPIEKCDMARIFVVYVDGGMYIDNKTRMKLSLKDLFDSRQIILLQEWHDHGIWANDPQVINAVFAATPRHDFLFQLLNYIKYSFPEIDRHTVYDATGPVAWGRIAQKLKLLKRNGTKKGRWIENKEYFLHPYTMMSSSLMHTPVASDGNEKYLILDFHKGSGWGFKVWHYFPSFLLERYHRLVTFFLLMVIIILLCIVLI
jgi:mannosyltransferase OCH1-like enzyme